MINKIVFVVLFCKFCSSTLLWRIESKPPAYIFGSIHVPYQLIWPYVSNETRQAFLSSTHVYAEVDTMDETYWDDFLRCVVHRSNRTRRSTKPFVVTDVLDVHLISEARRLNKTVGSLETVDIHCKALASRFNISIWGRIVHVMKQEMRNATIPIKQKKILTNVLIRKYNCDEITSRYFRTVSYKKKEKKHVEQRDKQISKHIHQLLQNSTTNRYFFIVGAAHMLSHHQNLKVRLKAFGYKITRICTDRQRIKKKYGCRKTKPQKHCLK